MAKAKKPIRKAKQAKAKKPMKKARPAFTRKASARRGKVLVSKKPKIQKPKKAFKATKPAKIVLKKKKKPKKTAKKSTKKIVKENLRKNVGKKVKKAAKKNFKKIVKKITRRKSPTKRLATEKPNFQAEELFKARIKVIGIGGGGGSIVSEIGRSVHKATFVIADTDIRALKKKSGIKYFWFGQEFTHGLGTGVNIDLAKKAAQGAKEKISQFFKDQDIIIFVASLGGGLGSGATQIFAEAAKEFGGITFGIFTMPFKFEGKNKQNIANSALKQLRQSLNVSLVIPNEKIFKIIDQSTPITNAFSTVNKSLIESLESLIDLIYNPGVINIDFADLRAILRGRGNTAFLNTIEESGKNRVEKTCENIFKNPLLQNSSVAASEKILFNIAGAENLSMFEVEKISSHISNQNPTAKIIFGISKNSKLKNKIKTTILMTGGEMKEPVPVPEKKPEPVKNTVKEKSAPVAVKKPAKKSKPAQKPKLEAKKVPAKKKEEKKTPKKNPIPQIPSISIQEPVLAAPLVEHRRLDLIEVPEDAGKKTIRRSALEIKRAEELQEQRRIDQEKEWETPAFLRKIKFNK